jgi:hypothetical protein
MEEENAKKKKAADEAAKKATEAAAAAAAEKVAAAAKDNLDAKIKAAVKTEVTKTKSDIMNANAVLQGEIDKAKADHIQKIIDGEKQCKIENRKAIEQAEEANASKLKSRQVAMDLERQALLDSQKSNLESHIAQLLKDQRAIYLEKEKIHASERAHDL